jgi:hypothetical protein
MIQTKRPIMKKEAPLDMQGAQKDLHQKKRHPQTRKGLKKKSNKERSTPTCKGLK